MGVVSCVSRSLSHNNVPSHQNTQRNKTMSDREKELDVEKGCGDSLPEGPTGASTTPRNANKPLAMWKIVTAILMVGLLVFAVAFPITRARDDDNKTASVIENPESESPATSQTKVYTSSNGVFDVKLNLFHKDIVNGYSDTQTLEDDLSNAAKFLINGVVKRNTEQSSYDHTGTGAPSVEGGDDAGTEPEVAESAPVSDESMTSDTPSSGLNDFGQNNQENDVEEGDMMVSNGEIGKYIVHEIWV